MQTQPTLKELAARVLEKHKIAEEKGKEVSRQKEMESILRLWNPNTKAN